MSYLKSILIPLAFGAAWMFMFCSVFMLVVMVKEGDYSDMNLYLALLLLQVQSVIGWTRSLVQNCAIYDE